MKEITLPENCPGCYRESKTDNLLRAQPGSFFGQYCLKAGSTSGEKGHVYTDTDELREELAIVAKLRKADKPAVVKADKPTEADPALAAETAVDEKLSTLEPKAFEVTEMDASRLSELLGQPIGDSGTLVGAVYSSKMTIAVDSSVIERRMAAESSVNTSADILQKGDGTLRLQIFLPWQVGKSMVDKAVFASIPLQDIVQGQIEFCMSGNSFPWDIESNGAVTEPYDGFWVVVSVPELYVGALLDKATQYGISPTQYLQGFVEDMIRVEQFT